MKSLEGASRFAQFCPTRGFQCDRCTAPGVHPAKARRIAANIAKLPEIVGRST